jgi:hypothetical protein
VRLRRRRCPSEYDGVGRGYDDERQRRPRLTGHRRGHGSATEDQPLDRQSRWTLQSML